MRVSTLIRITAVGSLGLVFACNDAATRPGASSTAERSAPTSGASAAFGSSHGKGDAVTMAQQFADRGRNVGQGVFVVYPGRPAIVAWGNSMVILPANAICDPLTSGYGPDLWNDSCTPASVPITITAAWSERGGYGYVEFQPELRFNPNTTVSLWMWNKTAITTTTYGILWRDLTGHWINEALTDPSLKPWISGNGQIVGRRIKHFSGYNVTASGCDPTDPTCTSSDGSGGSD